MKMNKNDINRQHHLLPYLSVCAVSCRQSLTTDESICVLVDLQLNTMTLFTESTHFSQSFISSLQQETEKICRQQQESKDEEECTPFLIPSVFVYLVVSFFSHQCVKISGPCSVFCTLLLIPALILAHSMPLSKLVDFVMALVVCICVPNKLIISMFIKSLSSDMPDSKLLEKIS